MKPFKKGQRARLASCHDDAASAFFLRPRLERPKEMCTVSPRVGDRVPGRLERGWLAGQVVRGDHSADARRDGISEGEINAIRIANVGNGKPSQSSGARFTSALLIIKAHAKLDKARDVVEGGTPNRLATHVDSRFCERSTPRSALIAFAASVGVGSSETPPIGPP